MLVIYFRKKYFIRRVNSETKNKHFDVITKTLICLKLQGPGINAKNIKDDRYFLMQYQFWKVLAGKPGSNNNKGKENSRIVH